eukprot:TRINITY_DN14817_c0_g1_i2.p1 TRINITY_DN14817_c0_g1~~TRINITY_DN14817_c0_g1_i2.p1  ORF type:complete len:101 (-),score=5.90 TRINITY_DN14817_c0_g1_i2:1323-1625(-)
MSALMKSNPASFTNASIQTPLALSITYSKLLHGKRPTGLIRRVDNMSLREGRNRYARKPFQVITTKKALKVDRRDYRFLDDPQTFPQASFGSRILQLVCL